MSKTNEEDKELIRKTFEDRGCEIISEIIKYID